MQLILYLFSTNWGLIILDTGYIGEFEIVDDHRSGKIVIQLNGRLNKTGVISPRYNVQVNQIETWVNLLLPARGFGIIILVRTSFICYRAMFLLTYAIYRRPRRVSWTMRRRVARTSVASSWAMFTRCTCILYALCRSYIYPKMSRPNGPSCSVHMWMTVQACCMIITDECDV